MQVDLHQVASWLQGLAVTWRNGLEPLHSYDGISGRYPSQSTKFGKSNALLVIYLSAFPLKFFNRVTQKELHRQSVWERKGFDTANAAVSFQGGDVSSWLNVFFEQRQRVSSRVGMVALASLVRTSACAGVKL